MYQSLRTTRRDVGNEDLTLDVTYATRMWTVTSEERIDAQSSESVPAAGSWPAARGRGGARPGGGSLLDRVPDK